MSKTFKVVVLLVIFLGFNSYDVLCHELLRDFLNFQVENPHIALSKDCGDHLEMLRNGIKENEVWALKVQDASGKPTSGFTWGNNFWLGAERNCYLLNQPPKISLIKSKNRRMDDNMTEIGSEIPVEYRMFYASHTSKIQFDADLFNKSVLHIGLCFPEACDETEVHVMAKKIFHEKFQDFHLYGEVNYLGTKTLTIRKEFLNETFVLLLLVIIVTFVVLAIIGTTYVNNLKSHRKDMKEISALPTFNNDQKNLKNKLKASLAEKFWRCFSLKDNCGFIMSTKINRKSIAPIHGVRAIGALWIMAGHVYYYAFGPTDNIQLIFSYANALVLQPLFAAAISVDSFYVMSGFLLSYAFYEKQKKRPSKQLTIDVIRGIVYRYIRITPCFMIIMLLAVTISIFLNDTSQYLMIENIEENCKNYWWRNVLCIQNFYPLSEMCMSWSWYVAADFQLFALSSILLAVSAKNMRLSVTIGITMVLLSSAYSGFIGLTESFSFSLDSQFRSINTLYTKPYTRIGGYFAGVWTGYYLSKISRQCNMRKTFINLGRIISLFLVIFLIFIQRYRVPENVFVSFFFPAFGRTLWAFPVCFVIIMGSTQYKDGIVTKIMNAKCLLPFSRMTYSAYLLNPLIVLFVTMSCENSFHVDFYSIVILTVGFYLVTYIAAFIFMLFFENPIIMFIRKFAE